VPLWRSHGLRLRPRAGALEQIEDHKHRRASASEICNATASGAQAFLETTEIGPARLVADDHLAVQQRAWLERTGCSQELREPGAQIAAVAAEKLHLTTCASPEEASEPVQLGLIAPVVADGQARIELRQHRGGRQDQHGAGG
jgi:hypothetical protein